MAKVLTYTLDRVCLRLSVSFSPLASFFLLDMIAAGLLVVFLLAPVLARPTPDLVVRGDLGGPPAGFTAGNAPSDAIKFTLALPQVDVNGLHAAVLDVSDPTSAKCRQHLSKAEAS